MDTFFLVTPPGLEALAREELAGYGIEGTTSIGGVEFKGTVKELYTANYYSRIGVKVLARVGMPFYARTPKELGQKAFNLPWERWITPGVSVAMHVTCKKSKLLHTGMVENVLRSAILNKVAISDATDARTPDVILVVRIFQDLAIVSVDTSGEPLYKRGYRQEVTRSPIRENLAAALIMASGWTPDMPLVDPFCGSGTIPIEATMIALRIAPGRAREFAFTKLPEYNPAAFREARGIRLPLDREIDIIGYDRDEGAITIAKNNAKRARLEDRITFKHQAVSYLKSVEKRGYIVANPPYGERISEGLDLRNLYAQFGKTIQKNLPGWVITLITNDLATAGHSGLKFNKLLSTENGGIRTDFITTNEQAGATWKE